MYLKRIYKDGQLDYLSLAHTGTHPEQNFSIKLVTEYLSSGLMQMLGNDLTLHCYPEPLFYRINRRPGAYCLHCGAQLPIENRGALARLHVAEKHAGRPSPVPGEPAGYVVLNHFECVLDAGQHEKYRLRPEHKARAPHFPLKGA